MASAQERAVAAQVLKEDAGWTVDQIAELFGADRSTVYRWLERVAADKKPQGSVTEELERMLEGVELDSHGRFNAQVARNLADILDKTRQSTIAQDRAASPAIAKQLLDIVEMLLEVTDDDKAWVQGLFQ